MRRLILIVMMLVLPLQYSWAAVAAVSAHAVQMDAEGHLGHHDDHHEHGAASGQVSAAEAAVADASAVDHDDGSNCHSHGHSHGSDALSVDWSLGVPECDGTLAAHGMRHMPAVHPDELLRPPLAPRA